MQDDRLVGFHAFVFGEHAQVFAAEAQRRFGALGVHALDLGLLKQLDFSGVCIGRGALGRGIHAAALFVEGHELGRLNLEVVHVGQVQHFGATQLVLQRASRVVGLHGEVVHVVVGLVALGLRGRRGLVVGCIAQQPPRTQGDQGHHNHRHVHADLGAGGVTQPLPLHQLLPVSS